MKKELKIVLTTDFTDSSLYAMDYAINAFSKWQSEVAYFLLHGFEPMVPYKDTGNIPVMSNHSREKESLQKLKKAADMLCEKHNIKVEPVFEMGKVSEVVQKFEKRENPDLFIMGTREKSFLERLAFGSNALEAMSNLNTSVIAIPLEAELKKPGKVMLAADFGPLAIPYESVELFKDLITMFKARLQVLHVFQSEEEMQNAQTLPDPLIHKYMEDLEHQHYSVVNDDAFDGIISFITDNAPDMVVTIPRDHNFIQKLFNNSITRKMTHEVNVPLLILK